MAVDAVAPGPPLNVSAVAGNGRATISFSPPSSNGGAPILSYAATASPGGAHASGPGSPITVTGLTNGLSYTFTVTVTATNSVGTGPPSAPSNAVTPAAPGGPVILSFSPTSGSLKTLVIIVGLHFIGVTRVTFNGVQAVFKLAPNGRIFALVPARATTGPISVTTNRGTTTSIGTFTVIHTNSIGPTRMGGPTGG